ncbi:hypothetical protein C1I99_23565, partial [Micromonospora deserti]
RSTAAPDTPVRSAWPVAPAWPVPPRTEPGPAVEVNQGRAEEAPDPAPRPRHLGPMPDFSRAASWEALATARRAGPQPASTADGAAEDAGTPAVDGPDTDPSRGAGSGGEAEQSAGRARGRLGLFRRNRPRAGEDGTGTPAEPEPLPAQDEEYVDWVAGLGRKVPDNEPDRKAGRRSMRSTGRHHRD